MFNTEHKLQELKLKY